MNQKTVLPLFAVHETDQFAQFGLTPFIGMDRRLRWLLVVVAVVVAVRERTVRERHRLLAGRPALERAGRLRVKRVARLPVASSVSTHRKS